MKKIYYLLLMLPLAFTACQKQPIVPLNPLTKTATLAFTLAPADYQLLPNTAYPYSSFSFNSNSDADIYVPMILNAKESAQLNNGSTAAVTFTIAPASLKVADSLSADVSYTLVKSDYALLPGNTFTDFSIAQILSWLPYKYPNPVANQLAVLTFTYFNSSNTPTTATVTFSFLYLNGAWKRIYQITPAQYTAAGEGRFDQFGASDNLVGDFNVFLKTDVTIADTAKANDVEYVSYAYFANSTNYQKVQALTFDGNNWGAISTTVTGSFLKSNGTWAAVLPVPTVNHTLTKADIALIVASSFGTASERTNLGQYGDFSGWSAADLDSSFILVLTTDYPSPQTGVNYVVTYLNYTGGADVPTQITFQWSGTAWAAH
jgi:hypothetical protein